MSKLSKVQSIIATAVKKGSGNAEDITFASAYAEPGYSDPESEIIAFSNWNDDIKLVRGFGWTKDGREIPGRLLKILSDRYGVECEWSDEWTTCSHCGKAIRTRPDSYSWKPYYVLGGGEITCGHCIKEDPEEYLRSLEGEASKCITIDIDPAQHGYVKYNGQFEGGCSPGQKDDPKKIKARLAKLGITRVIFNLDYSGQFDIQFSCWVHREDENIHQINTTAAEAI